MIKFIRHIRQSLMIENKTSQYIKYALGEVVLVVIGILIALWINNWNQERLNNKKELDLLMNLKDELILNVSVMNSVDSTYASKERECLEGMQLLKGPLSLETFLKINDLVTTNWPYFRVNRSTYDEMLNSGSFYSLDNKNLQEKIRKHFEEANYYVGAFQEINENGQDITHNNEELYVIELIEDMAEEENAHLEFIDTSWLKNPNSPTYLTYYKKAKYFTAINSTRRRLIKSFIESCETLSTAIDTELNKPQ